MAETKFSQLVAAMARQSAVIDHPLNTPALAASRAVALESASNLWGYYRYLQDLRRHKAAGKTVPSAVERDLVRQARQALGEARRLANCVVRSIRELEATGTLDRMLDAGTAGVTATGPLDARSLWRELVADPATRTALRRVGVVDNLFARLNEQVRTIEGRFSVERGAFAIEREFPGQDRVRRAVLRRSARGLARTPDELLARDAATTFLTQFERGAVLPLESVVAPAPDTTLAAVLLGGTLAGLRGVAQHVRTLEDTGLSIHAGSDLLTALFIVGLVLAIAGIALVDQYCGGDESDSGLCQLGLVLLFFAGILLFPASPLVPHVLLYGFVGLMKLDQATS